eukprot:11319103-Ditylum_brightwellii.AAC.1
MRGLSEVQTDASNRSHASDMLATREENAPLHLELNRMSEENSIMKAQVRRRSEENSIIKAQVRRQSEENSIIKTQMRRQSEEIYNDDDLRAMKEENALL